MKALITGSAGFYGSYLSEELAQNGYEVIRCDLIPAEGILAADITNADQMLELVSQHRPDVLINMAGQANVGLSWKKPQLTVQLNTVGLINILEAVKAVDPGIRVIAIGSSDEYGRLKERGTDVTEDMPVHPMTPYAVSKQAQEQFAHLYHQSFGMDICMIRQFNLGGAGQAKGYLIPDFASGIAEIEAGLRDCMSVGNLESARDFTHVRDAGRAIRLIAEKGHAGEVYNICSGTTHTAKEILDKLIAMSSASVTVRQDPAKMRPSDTPVVCGNHAKLTAHTGWEPRLGIDEILRDVLDYQRSLLAEESQ